MKGLNIENDFEFLELVRGLGFEALLQKLKPGCCNTCKIETGFQKD